MPMPSAIAAPQRRAIAYFRLAGGPLALLGGIALWPGRFAGSSIGSSLNARLTFDVNCTWHVVTRLLTVARAKRRMSEKANSSVFLAVRAGETPTLRCGRSPTL